MKQMMIGLAVLVVFSTGPGLARDVPTLPATAKKLDAAGIRTLYHGMRGSFDNFQNEATLTGEVFYDMDRKVMFGTYNWDNKDKGLFKGKAWIKGDQFCNKPDKGKQTCTDVYLDGRDYYETDAKGKVVSADKILDNPPALPAGAKPIKAQEVLAMVKGKRIFVTIYDYDKPLVADVKWDLKKKKSVGRFIFGGTKEGKANAAYVVKNDTICFPDGGKDNCYAYFQTEDGFWELNDKGAVHGVSTFQ